eukprot:TRINITY_DN710_c0_g1_i3.p1 TRINITY_DN710_c0_g1~~TRINITY_DN710_c0_g1_i3.p1  ORF type:complete len:296 (-),score=46.08 TRINITY_DN710_c0_g1_i3:107-994(-)
MYEEFIEELAYQLSDKIILIVGVLTMEEQMKIERLSRMTNRSEILVLHKYDFCKDREEWERLIKENIDCYSGKWFFTGTISKFVDSNGVFHLSVANNIIFEEDNNKVVQYLSEKFCLTQQYEREGYYSKLKRCCEDILPRYVNYSDLKLMFSMSEQKMFFKSEDPLEQVDLFTPKYSISCDDPTQPCIITIELPGVATRDFRTELTRSRITISGELTRSRITISGERKLYEKLMNSDILVPYTKEDNPQSDIRRPNSPFCLKISVPKGYPMENDTIVSNMENGLLTFTISPKNQT